MKLKVLFMINAIIAIVFGIAFAIIPAQVYSLYGIESNAGLNYMGQLFGSALIGFVIALIGQLNEILDSLGWLTVAIYFLLSLGFGYFQFSKPKSTEA